MHILIKGNFAYGKYYTQFYNFILIESKYIKHSAE